MKLDGFKTSYFGVFDGSTKYFLFFFIIILDMEILLFLQWLAKFFINILKQTFLKPPMLSYQLKKV